MTTVETIASNLQGRAKTGGGYLCHCPAHDDRHPSLSVDVGNNGTILVNCFAGCTQDAIVDKLKEMGIWPAHPINDVSSLSSSAAPPLQVCGDKEVGQTASHQLAAILAAQVWNAAGPAEPDHPYLVRKQVKPTSTMRELDRDQLSELIGYIPRSSGEPLREGRILVIPVKVGDKLSTLEFIDIHGKKSALVSGKKASGYWASGKIDEAAGSSFLLIGEGVATTLSAAEATKGIAVATLSSSNLLSVARIIDERYPGVEIVILADLVKKTGEPDPNAIEAARKTGAKLAIPGFGENRAPNSKDFNDLAIEQGCDAVSVCIQAAIDGLRFNSNEDWPEPVKLRHDKPPPLNISEFPPPLGTMIESVSAATETPVELSALLGLATCAAACQKRFEVEVEPGYSEPLNLWTLTLLEPGNRKSAVLRMFSRPLIDYEQQKTLELEPEILSAQTAQKNQEERIKELRRQYAKAKSQDRDEIERELYDLESQPVEMPRTPRVWCQDITPEKLGTFMAENGECATILSAEGGIFENIAGRYSGNVPNLDIFLQGHAGDPVRVDRGSREAIYMRSPALTIGLSVQPGILDSLARYRGFRSFGLWARFLFAIPESPLGRRTLNTIPVDQAIANRFNRAIYDLLELKPPVNEHGTAVPYLLRLSSEAHRIWKSFALGVEKQLADGGEFDDIKDWAAKLPGVAARIAGVFHCVASAENQPWETPISEEIMEKALNLAATLSRHALVVFERQGASQGMQAAKKIHDWVIRQQEPIFSQRDCHQALRGSFPKVADLMPGLETLIDRYHIRGVEIEHSGPGRRPIVYEVHPSIAEAWR